MAEGVGMTTDIEPSDPILVRPTVSFKDVTFSDGHTLSFNDDEIVVFVGPNNAGKSAALRGLQAWISKSHTHPVITGATLTRTGTGEEFRAYLEEYSQKTGGATNPSYGGMGYNIHHSHINLFPDHMEPIAGFFSAHIATETRITASNPAGPIELYVQPPFHPIHLLMMDSNLEAKISTYFRRAFGSDLIVFRAGGSRFPLYVGQKPARLGDEDALTKTYIDRMLASAAPLESQGDGMRSFATVLLYVLAANNHSIQFLDEPEAFLHPPQARLLGEYIAKERRTKSQLFIATHSTDILDGLMVGGPNKIRIVRMQRTGDVNHIKELSKKQTAEISKDTLTKYSRVLEGIFYEHVMITESDSDCLFYSSILNTRLIAGDLQPDVLFIHASGKHRMGKLAETLKSLDVPVSVIADLDILNDEVAFKSLFEKLGGQWDEVSSHWRAIKMSVEEVRPSLTAIQVRGLIESELAHVSGVGVFPKLIEQKIGAIFRSQSAWDVIKRTGRSGFRSGQPINHFDSLAAICEVRGLWFVPVGELEGFCRSIATHGPSFVEKVLEERDLENDEELAPARAFVKRIWESTRVTVASRQGVP